MFDHVPSFQASDHFDKALMLWKVKMDTLDEDMKAKESIEARAYDLYRNNDLMRALVEKQVDALVGSRVSVRAMPDWERLGATQQEALDWQRLANAEFDTYAHSPDNWFSADRSMDITQMARSAARAEIMTGEILSSREFRQTPVTYQTCFQLVSSHRLKTPKSLADNRVFHGIEFDEFGEALAYHIESARIGQKRNFGQKEIKRYGRRNDFNWLQIYHLYDPIIPEYPRGISRLACIIKPLIQRARYIELDLDKHIIAANYAMVIKSDSDPDSIADMLSGADQYGSNSFAVEGADSTLPPDVKAHKDEILKSITQRVVEMTGGHMMHLFSGEDASILQAPNAGQTSGDYAADVAKHIANGAGMSYAYASGDFKGLSFSANQMDIGILENSMNIRRQMGVYKLCRLWHRTWLDEAMLKGTLPLLGGKEYWPNRELYARSEVSGAKQVHVDPLKNSKTNTNELANMTTSRTEIMSRLGIDLDKILMDRATEADKAVQAIETVMAKHGVAMSDDAKASLIIDIVGTSKVETPDAPAENEDDDDVEN